MSDELTDALNGFAYADSITAAWDSARRLMLNKRRAVVANDPLLLRGLERLRDWATTGSSVERLLAVDLLVRVPASVRKIRTFAASLLREALREQLPPLSFVTEKKEIPQTAKPAEIRENVARALEEARGDWVVPYLVTSLAEEEKSQRCRFVLSQQIAERIPEVERWFEYLLKEPVLHDLVEKQGPDSSVARLRDISLSLCDSISARRDRLQISESCGHLLSRFARAFVPLGSRDALPKRLAEAAVAVVRLLDEMLAVRLTLMDEPQFYEVLEPLKRWWSPAPYPKPLSEGLRPIIEKIIAGITFRARAGQQSERLVQRLRQALNDDKEAKSQLSDLASREHGLSADVQDWLLGIERKPAPGVSSRIITAVSEEGFIRAISPAFLLAEEALASSRAQGSIPKIENQVANLIVTVGKQYGLEIVGSAGDKVEYLPSAYETIDGRTPSDRDVEIVRPMVVRRRSDGTRDVVVKGLVKAL